LLAGIVNLIDRREREADKRLPVEAENLKLKSAS